jgi:hypothetical protein
MNYATGSERIRLTGPCRLYAIGATWEDDSHRNINVRRMCGIPLWHGWCRPAELSMTLAPDAAHGIVDWPSPAVCGANDYFEITSDPDVTLQAAFTSTETPV